MKLRTFQPRRGFTMVEILVVVSILAILMGLVAVAVFPSQHRQHASNTRALLKKLDKAVVEQWAATLKEARNEKPPDSIIFGMANGDEKFARAIWVKLRLRAEFPMTYADAVNPWVKFLPAWVPTSNNGVTQAGAYYRKQLGTRTMAIKPDTEAAALLLFALQKPRAGIKFTAEEALGPSAIRDTDSDGLKEIIDSWGVPVGFYRWGTSNAELEALNTTALGIKDRDKEDLEHALMDGTRNLPASQAVLLFQQICHPIRDANGPRSYYTEPVVVSAGRDGQFAFVRDTAGIHFPLPNYFVPMMTPIPPSGPTAPNPNDNLYSFKQR